MSLFHCSYFLKQLPNGFPIAIFTLSESLVTSLMHGSHNPARKTIRYSFITIQMYSSWWVGSVHDRHNSAPELAEHTPPPPPNHAGSIPVPYYPYIPSQSLL